MEAAPQRWCRMTTGKPSADGLSDTLRGKPLLDATCDGALTKQAGDNLRQRRSYGDPDDGRSTESSLEVVDVADSQNGDSRPSASQPGSPVVMHRDDTLTRPLIQIRIRRVSQERKGLQQNDRRAV